jgi:hypothetical protein
VCQTQTGPTPIPLNGACSTWGVPCVYRSYCGAADGEMTCLSVSTTIGTPCPIEVTACAPPLHCEACQAAAPAYGTCAAPAAEGAPATTGANVDFPCASLTDTCNFKTGTCDPVVSDGATCALGTLCVGRDYCADGYVCLPLPGPGDACTPGASRCLLDLVCDPTTSTCQLPTGPGCGASAPASRARGGRVSQPSTSSSAGTRVMTPPVEPKKPTGFARPTRLLIHVTCPHGPAAPQSTDADD